MSSEEIAKKRMNLVAIQNVDPYAREIVDSSPHVAYYRFSTEWEKTETEGSFFVYSRVAEPYHSIFINNRLNTTSLVEPITAKIELQEQAPFLLYRNLKSIISGFWFYSKEDCVRIHSLLEKLIKKCNYARPPDSQAVTHQQQMTAKAQNGGKKDVDIFSMLSKAQEDFNVSSSSAAEPPGPKINQQLAGMNLNLVQGPVHHHQPQQQQQQHQQHQPLMKQLSNAMPDITSPNVVNFFAAAQQPNGGPNKAGPPKIHQQSHNGNFMINQKAPPVQTLDEIEKQHRVSASPPQPKAEPKTIKSDFNNLLNSVAQQQQQHQQQQLPAPPQPVKLQQPGAFQSSNKPALITPAMFQAPKPVEEKVANVRPAQPPVGIRPEPLTQNQLMQALNYLLETDPDFIRKIHEAYIKSFNKMVSL